MVEWNERGRRQRNVWRRKTRNLREKLEERREEREEQWWLCKERGTERGWCWKKNRRWWLRRVTGGKGGKEEG